MAPARTPPFPMTYSPADRLRDDPRNAPPAPGAHWDPKTRGWYIEDRYRPGSFPRLQGDAQHGYYYLSNGRMVPAPTTSRPGMGLPLAPAHGSIDPNVHKVPAGPRFGAVYDLSRGQSRYSIPLHALYYGPDGSIRRNDNWDEGNPILLQAPTNGARIGRDGAFYDRDPSRPGSLARVDGDSRSPYITNSQGRRVDLTPSAAAPPPPGAGRDFDRAHPVDLSHVYGLDYRRALDALPYGAFYYGPDRQLRRNSNGWTGNAIRPDLLPKGAYIADDGYVYGPDPTKPGSFPRYSYDPSTGWYLRSAKGYLMSPQLPKGAYVAADGFVYGPDPRHAGSFPRYDYDVRDGWFLKGSNGWFIDPGGHVSTHPNNAFEDAVYSFKGGLIGNVEDLADQTNWVLPLARLADKTIAYPLLNKPRPDAYVGPDGRARDKPKLPPRYGEDNHGPLERLFTTRDLDTGQMFGGYTPRTPVGQFSQKVGSNVLGAATGGETLLPKVASAVVPAAAGQLAQNYVASKGGSQADQDKAAYWANTAASLGMSLRPGKGPTLREKTTPSGDPVLTGSASVGDGVAAAREARRLGVTPGLPPGPSGATAAEQAGLAARRKAAALARRPGAAGPTLRNRLSERAAGASARLEEDVGDLTRTPEPGQPGQPGQPGGGLPPLRRRPPGRPPGAKTRGQAAEQMADDAFDPRVTGEAFDEALAGTHPDTIVQGRAAAARRFLGNAVAGSPEALGYSYRTVRKLRSLFGDRAGSMIGAARREAAFEVFRRQVAAPPANAVQTMRDLASTPLRQARREQLGYILGQNPERAAQIVQALEAAGAQPRSPVTFDLRGALTGVATQGPPPRSPDDRPALPY